LSTDAVEGVLPQQHHSMAKRDRDHVDLYSLSNKHPGDPALKVGIFSCYLRPLHS
jgi:hypothetical protein